MFFILTLGTFLIFLSIGLQSYGLYLLSTIYRNSESLTKAGLTYFLQKGLSSCILYANSGNANLGCLTQFSLGITLFSFLGVPPLVGFFAKQMVITAALDSGYIFITLLVILASAINAVY